MRGRQWWVLRHALGGVQYFSSTPRSPSFFAKESLRFAAFAAVSVAAWMALGPLLEAALISPNLWAASASATLECGNQFSMRNGWIHIGSFIDQRHHA